MTDNVIDFEAVQDRRDEKQSDQFRAATIDRLTQNILAECEVDTIGAITPIVLALEQALISILAITCAQFRNGFNEGFARRLPLLVRQANQLADARGYCSICRGDAICEPEKQGAGHDD